MKKVIRVIVGPKGETTIETRGFSGESCRDASRAFEQALGRPAGEQLTPEFYQEQPAEQQIRQSQ
jgi:hypothetical protein